MFYSTLFISAAAFFFLISAITCFFITLLADLETNIAPIFFSFARDVFYPRCPSVPLSLRRVCVRAAFQPAPGCRLIVDNYSYLTAAFTASPFWRHLQRENMPSRSP